MAFLKLVAGTEPGKTFEITGDTSVIGRSSECDVPIDVAAVSRRHAAIVQDGGRYYLKDLKSRNGTQLNGQDITTAPLREGDRIVVCDQEFSFHQDLSTDLLGEDSTTYGREESSLTQMVIDDEEEGSRASVMATLDLGPGSASWTLSAKPEVKLAALVEISNNLGQALSVDEILPKLLDSLFKIFVQADRAFVVMRPTPDAPLVPVEWRIRRKDDDESPRLSRTIIEQAMESRQAILSADAASDERFGMAQSIAEFQIRSMICAPMIDGDGVSLGVLQVDTTNQRSRFTDEDLEVLAGVASQAATALDNAKMHEQVLAQRAVQRDLDLAARMQRALLPASAPQADGYDFFSFYESAREIGGDYYDYVPLPDGRFAVVVGDVAGKGVAAALLMARLSSDVRFSLASEPDLARAVMGVNRSFAQHGWDDRFVTMIVAVVDPKRHEMTLVNAGHMAPLLRAASGAVEPIGEETAGLPIGVAEDYEFESVTRSLAPGDVVTAFTDGFSEAMNAERELYGLTRLAEVAGSNGANVSELGQAILSDVRAFVSGFAQSDDMCLTCFGRNPL